MKVRNPLAKGILIGATVATLTGAIASHVWADAQRSLWRQLRRLPWARRKR